MEPIINLLKAGLDGASMRQKALSNNIANASTPNYKRQDIDFISSLKREVAKKGMSLSLTTSSAKHHNSFKTSFKNRFKTNDQLANQVETLKTSYKNDKNSVDIEVEMAELAKNSIYYDTLVTTINDRFKNLNDAITKGGR